MWMLINQTDCIKQERSVHTTLAKRSWQETQHTTCREVRESQESASACGLEHSPQLQPMGESAHHSCSREDGLGSKSLPYSMKTGGQIPRNHTKTPAMMRQEAEMS